MPELPEVETFRRTIERGGLNRRITGVETREARVLVTPAEQMDARLRGRLLRSARRHGKHVFLETDIPDVWVYLHFGMTGHPALLLPGEDPPRHTRMLFRYSDGGALALVDPRQFGKAGLIRSPEEFISERKLGPDPMDPGTGVDGIRAALAGRRGGLKATLLDQTVLAGVGNLYADEILYRARIHPLTSALELDAHELGRLARVVYDVLREAVDLDAEYDRYHADWLIHRRREGESCPCGGTLHRIRAGGRTTYFCPACQMRR